MISKEELSTALAHFSGTESYLRHRMFGGGRGILLTDGARYVAEKAGAWWLMDAILSYQPQCRRDPMLSQMQFWTLKKTGSTAVLTCERDEGDVAITQEIPYTDFPLDEIKLWVELGSVDGETPDYVMMLPSER